MILARIIGQLNAPTTPEYGVATAAIQNESDRLNYHREHLKEYQGNRATASILNDMMYGAEKTRKSYQNPLNRERDNLYSSLISEQLNQGLYQKLMTGYHTN